MSFPIIEVQDRFTTLINYKSYTVQSDHPKYEELLQAVRDKDAEEFHSLFSAAKAVEQSFVDTGVVVKDGAVFYKGTKLQNTVTKRIVEFSQANKPVQAMCNFLANLMENPSARAVNELLTFLENRALPITDDGCFCAYKSVRDNYLDKYSGKFDNSVGAVLEMPRNQVDDNASATCSHGFHVGAIEYAGPGGWYNNSQDKVMIVKVNPRDAVSVPADHSAQKLRVCRYEVVGEYEQELDDVYHELPKFPTSKSPKIVDPYEGFGETYKQFSHTDSHGHEVQTIRRKFKSVDGTRNMVCYNTDGSVRWISKESPSRYWGGLPKRSFERLTEAK